MALEQQKFSQNPPAMPGRAIPSRASNPKGFRATLLAKLQKTIPAGSIVWQQGLAKALAYSEVSAIPGT